MIIYLPCSEPAGSTTGVTHPPIEERIRALRGMQL